MVTFEEDERFIRLTSNIENLNKYELSTLNRYYYHKVDKRCCKDCRLVQGPIAETYHIKKYDGKYVLYNSVCKTCFNEQNRNRVKEYRKDYATFIRSRFSSYRHRALTNNTEFDLDPDYLVDLYKNQDSKCFYTGEYISFEYVTKKGDHPHLNTPSLDRMNPNLGYTRGNVVWCSYKINRMKNDLMDDQFYKMCAVVLERFNERIL